MLAFTITGISCQRNLSSKINKRCANWKSILYCEGTWIAKLVFKIYKKKTVEELLHWFQIFLHAYGYQDNMTLAGE